MVPGGARRTATRSLRRAKSANAAMSSSTSGLLNALRLAGLLRTTIPTGPLTSVSV